MQRPKVINMVIGLVVMIIVLLLIQVVAPKSTSTKPCDVYFNGIPQC